MKKINLLKWGFLSLFCALCSFAWADDTSVTITWPMGDEISNSSTTLTCTIDPTTTGITTDYSIGSTLSWSRTKSYGTDDVDDVNYGWYGVTFSEVTAPDISSSDGEETAASENNAMKFLITVPTGYTFTPTKISFIPINDGTNDPRFDVSWINGESSTSLATSQQANRPSSSTSTQDAAYQEFSYESKLADITATEAGITCGLCVNVLKLYSGKYFGLAQVVIEGTLTSTDDTATDPEEGGNDDNNTTGETTTATWDWANDNPAGIKAATAYEGSTAYIESTIAGLYMYVDAQNGKLNSAARSSDCQFNNGTILHVPVVSTSDVVTVTSDDDNGELTYSSYSIGGIAATSIPQTYTATSDDVDQGYVVIQATGSNCYLQSVSVEYANADDLDNVDEEYLRPSVSLVSPTQDDFDDTPLAVNQEIKVSVINLPDGGSVYFMLYDENGDEYYGYQCTKDGEGYYTCTWGNDGNSGWDESKANETYTGKILIYSTSYNDNDYLVDAAHTIFTTAGLVKTTDVTLESVSPEAVTDEDDYDTEATIKTSETEITLTFSDLAKVTSASMNYYKGSDAITISKSDDTSDYATEWTLTLTEDMMSSAASMEMLKLIVYAEDEDGVSIGDNGYIYISYTTVEDDSDDNGDETEVSWTISPEDGDEIVGSVSEITISTDDAIDINWDLIDSDEGGSAINVINTETQATVASFDYDSDYVQGTNDITWTLSPAITEAGTYSITLPAGLVYLMDDEDVVLGDTTITFTITAIECEATPSSTVELDEETNTIHLNFTTDVNIAEDDISIVDEDENAVSFTMSGSDESDYTDSWEIVIDADAITELAGSSITLTVTAKDANGAEVSGEYTWSVAGETGAEVNTTYTYTTTPENNSTISNEDGVSEIVVIYDTELIANWDGDFDYDEFDETSIVVYDDEDNEVTAVKSWGFDEYEEYDEDGVPTVVGYTFTLSDAITTNGTYHFTIPEGAFLLGADQSIVSEEINVTFNIADASGINGITLKAGADDRFYNLNGQRVTSPRNGVYILNGKKILIK